jgi:hypothetical protein
MDRICDAPKSACPWQEDFDDSVDLQERHYTVLLRTNRTACQQLKQFT